MTVLTGYRSVEMEAGLNVTIDVIESRRDAALGPRDELFFAAAVKINSKPYKPV